jgi:hypothetical protein
MAVYDYTYNLTTYPTITTNSSTIGSTSSCTVWGCGCSGWHYYPYTYHTCPEPVRLYQILCPKPGCTGKFWAEVDEIKECPVCKKKIKISEEPPADYEVTITK